ncbi:Filamentation induced by cAMP protein Fic [Methanoculleus bourgensis]|jgi:Fic family protein|uniref:Filamentation induced by cAMP protein Fic n=1 Tax=Methanoculleus bourgensis TaxID=83986 RepID=A0A0X3BP93_9EURY|nr:Fic family protein [Methanomicrobiales archaeon]CVK33345.1 Filamentation induced by cAMP protein Fic [Methanoculleus bourgensis]
MTRFPERPPQTRDGKILKVFSDIVEDPDFRKTVTDYNNRYLAWDELTYRIPDPEKRLAAWTVMKMLRVMRYEPVPFAHLDLRYSITSESSRNLHVFDQYLSGIIRIHNRTIRLDQSYIINSFMEEAIASSILEGAATTRRAAKEVLRRGIRPRNRSEQMVVNSYKAMQSILERKDEPLTPELILETHRIVTENTLNSAAVGRFRETDDIVVADPVTGTVYHTPPDHAKIPAMIDELCRFANADDEEDAGRFTHPIVKGIILHFLIGYIHPFEDGNGRTARSIFYWYVLSRGYWLFEYMPISRIILRSKRDYALAYLRTEHDEMDLTYFILYNIRCIEEARKDLLAYIEKKQSEQNRTEAIIKSIRGINQRQAEILLCMMERGDEHFSIRQVMATYGVVYQTARTDLLRLAELGYIRKEKRGREFMFAVNRECDLWKRG